MLLEVMLRGRSSGASLVTYIRLVLSDATFLPVHLSEGSRCTQVVPMAGKTNSSHSDPTHEAESPWSGTKV